MSDRGPKKCLVMRITDLLEVDSDGSCGNADRRGVKCARNMSHVDTCVTPDGTWDHGVKCQACHGQGTVPLLQMPGLTGVIRPSEAAAPSNCPAGDVATLPAADRSAEENDAVASGGRTELDGEFIVAAFELRAENVRLRAAAEEIFAQVEQGIEEAIASQGRTKVVKIMRQAFDRTVRGTKEGEST